MEQPPRVAEGVTISRKTLQQGGLGADPDGVREAVSVPDFEGAVPSEVVHP